MAHQQDHHASHLKTYINVAIALFVLTFLTIIAHHFKDVLGVMAAPVAFLIASIKAALVMLWFMHLKDDDNTNRVIFGSGFFFLFILFLFSALDIWTRIKELSSL